MSPPPAEEESVAPDATRWFSEEVHTHDHALRSYLRRSYPAIRDIEDVVQESYLRIWRRQLARPIDSVQTAVTVSVKGFLFQVARRLAIDVLRRERSSPIAPGAERQVEAAFADARNPGDQLCSDDEFQLVLDAIDSLPDRCREVFVLRRLQGLSAADTAQRLGISQETVHVQTRRGLERVQSRLSRLGVVGTYQP